MDKMRIGAVDYHTAGHAFRVVTAGIPEVPGHTVADRRAAAARYVDRYRRLLCHEPRGHRDMYGCFLVPPDGPGAHLGALFWHADGYSTACGHGTIALGTWAVESGAVPAAADGSTDVVIDVPSGRVTARVRTRSGAVTGVTFRNVASRVLARNLPVRTSLGPIAVDAAYSGAIYLSVPATACGLTATAADLPALGQIAAELRNSADDPRLGEVYGVIFHDDLPSEPDTVHQRSVTFFADGRVDRSPSGSGTCARMALLLDEGRLPVSGRFVHESVVGGRFTATLAGDGMIEVDGRAHRIGEHTFVADPEDHLGTGFLLDGLSPG